MTVLGLGDALPLQILRPIRNPGLPVLTPPPLGPASRRIIPPVRWLCCVGGPSQSGPPWRTTVEWPRAADRSAPRCSGPAAATSGRGREVSQRSAPASRAATRTHDPRVDGRLRKLRCVLGAQPHRLGHDLLEGGAGAHQHLLQPRPLVSPSA